MFAAFLAGALVFFALHISLWRARPSHEPRIFFLTFLSTIGLMASFLWGRFYFNVSIEQGFNLWCYGSAFYMTYLYVYSGLCRSVSVTLLCRLLGASGAVIPQALLIQEYASSSRFTDRLEVMKKAGWLELQNGVAALTDKGQSVARKISFISNIVSGGLEG